ncbi:MAG: DUF362 domain-containing protein [Syntrophobacteraceae bacterium]
MALRSRDMSRREFLKCSAVGLLVTVSSPLPVPRSAFADSAGTSPVFWIRDIPEAPFIGGDGTNHHAGVESLLSFMGSHGRKFYRSSSEAPLSGPSGMIDANDVVLIKVNGQWKYRGCTNSDLIRGIIQRILDHPDGFAGEVVIIENGQGQGSLDGNARGWGAYPDSSIQANANDPSHSFNYLVDTVFSDDRVSSYLLDSIRSLFIATDDHTKDGYRRYEDVSYPCFTTRGGYRVELLEGIWHGGGYSQNLKLINVPVLKHHDTGGSEITASLKHVYGILSMEDGHKSSRHYAGLGRTCGKMMVSVRTPILNIVDAIWVSHRALSGYPESTTFRANQLMASQDPVALDFCSARHILYPVDNNPRHHPGYAGIDRWLTDACTIINERGGLSRPEAGILVGNVTKSESSIALYGVSVSVGPVLTVALDPVHGGGVSSDPPGITCQEAGDLSCAMVCAPGQRLTLAASASPGYTFVSWIGPSVSSSENPLALTVDSDVDLTARFVPSSAHLPFRPVQGAVTLGFGASVSGMRSPHHGADYASAVWEQVNGAGTGVIHRLTGARASGLGSIRPNGAGPGIWIRYKLANGEPVYVLYAHAATEWADSSVGAGTKAFRFRCTYAIKWQPGDIVQGEPLGLIAPFYNAKNLDAHLHVSVFKPGRDKRGTFYGPPSGGWEYGSAVVRTGTFIDPEEFFAEWYLLDEI